MDLDKVFEDVKSALEFLLDSKIVGVEIGVGSVIESKDVLTLAVEKDGMRYLIRITGDLDCSIVQIKDSQKRSKLIKQIVEIIATLEDKEYESGVPEDRIVEVARSKAIPEYVVKEILKELRERGEVYCPRKNFYKLVSRF